MSSKFSLWKIPCLCPANCILSTSTHSSWNLRDFKWIPLKLLIWNSNQNIHHQNHFFPSKIIKQLSEVNSRPDHGSAGQARHGAPCWELPSQVVIQLPTPPLNLTSLLSSCSEISSLTEDIASHLGVSVGSCLVYHNTNRQEFILSFQPNPEMIWRVSCFTSQCSHGR